MKSAIQNTKKNMRIDATKNDHYGTYLFVGVSGAIQK